MGKHPIRCGFMCPLRIALTLGHVAHTTSVVKSGEKEFVAILGKMAKIHPKVVTPNIISPYHNRYEPRAFAWMQTEALPPFCNKGWGSKHNGSIFNTPILEAHYLWEKVHIPVILVCTYLWIIEEYE